METISDGKCIPNISTAERRKRLLSGLIFLLFSLAVLTVLVITGISPWWRLGLAPFLFAVASGYFQWKDET
jgi:hypothetical protein